MENIPVFIINGFLDAGKTSFIESTITKDNFFQKGRTLYIALEEGEEEISSITLERYNVDKITFSSQEEFSLENLKEAVEDYDPSRIVIEMNFMFDMTKIEFPNYFQIAQIITLIDGVTFPLYFQNMRQKFVDVIKTSDIVCFTKLKSRESLDFFQTSLRLVNSTCMYCLIDEDGNYLMDAFRKVLPYSLDDKIINIKDENLLTKIYNYLYFILETWLSKYYSLIIKNKIDLYNKEDILTMASIYKDNGFIDASYKLCLSYINMFENDYHVHNIEDVKKFMKTLSKSKEPEHIENNSYKMYKGYCIYTELEATDHIYYIRSGRIGIYNIADSSYITRMIYPAHFVIDDYAPTLEYKTLFTTAIVLEDSIVEILTKEELVKKLHDNAELRFRMIKITSMKVISTILKIKSINKTELKDKLIVLIYAILKIETLFSEKTYIKLYYKIEDIKNMMHDDIDINDIQNALKNIEYLETDCFNNIIITDSCKYFKEYESYTK